MVFTSDSPLHSTFREANEKKEQEREELEGQTRKPRRVGKVLNRSLKKAGKQKETGLEFLRSFDLKPQEVIEYLNRYVIEQDEAKEVLAVALCDHYNHVRRQLSAPDVEQNDYAKPNILL